jgi:hypothetical protein
MKDRRVFAAAMGFAFVAAWIAFNFGEAILCLLGAAVFWTLAAVIEGDLDLGELQGRLRGGQDEGSAVPPPQPRPRPKTRVQ